MTVVDIVVAVLLLGGCFFALTAGVGMLRMPDFYTRLHPAGMTDTLGQALVLAALIIMVIAGPPNRAAADDDSDTAGEHAQTQPATQPETVAHDDHGGHDGHVPKAGTQAPDWVTAIKLVLIFVFLTITCPTSTHAITRAAHLARLPVWMNDESRANEAKANAPPATPADPPATPATPADPPAPPAEGGA